MSNPNGARGARAERDLVVWLRANGYPDAVRARGEGSVDRGDIGGIPRVAVQVKSAMRDAYVMPRLRDAQRGALEQAHGRRPVAVVKLPGVGDPAQWWAATPVVWFRGFYDLPIDARDVSPRCPARMIHAAIGEHGGALRAGTTSERASRRPSLRSRWWITTCERLFGALPGAVTS